MSTFKSRSQCKYVSGSKLHKFFPLRKIETDQEEGIDSGRGSDQSELHQMTHKRADGSIAFDRSNVQIRSNIPPAMRY